MSKLPVGHDLQLICFKFVWMQNLQKYNNISFLI